MPLLQIDFAAGFNHTKAEVEIDKKKVADFSLTTDYSAGFAHIYKSDLENKKILLNIKVPELNQQKNMELAMVKDTFLVVNLTAEGKLDVSSSNEKIIYF